MQLKAQWSFEAAYRGDTKNAFYALGMGWIMDEIERYDEAIKWYEEALKLRPGLVEAKYNIGCALAKSGRPEPAYDLIFAIRGEPQIRQVLAAEAETELKAIKNWNAEKFRSLLT